MRRISRREFDAEAAGEHQKSLSQSDECTGFDLAKTASAYLCGRYDAGGATAAAV